jgi:glycosyltransferase involved in cell wall biosynthesis
LKAILKRLLIVANDQVRYCSLAAQLRFLLATLESRLANKLPRRLAALTKAYQLTNNPAAHIRLATKLAPHLQYAPGNLWFTNQIGWDRYPASVRTTPVNRSIILKAPQSNGEKGVLLLMYEYNWLRVMQTKADLSYLDENFHIILSTSWSPTNFAYLALALARLHSNVFVQACNHNEIFAIQTFSPRLKCLPMIACDWINEYCYSPKPFADRTIDILMVANWAPFKRHWHLFDALRKLPADLRVTLVGQTEPGRTVESIRDEIHLFGARQEIELCDNLPIDEVAALQCNAKTSLILSRREGCCVAAVEALFANSALGLLDNAYIGPKAYINNQTGRLLDHRRLASSIRQLLAVAPSLTPRQWAIDNISCFKSAEKLNRFFREYSARQKLPWTSDVKTPYWHPYPQHVDPKDFQLLKTTYDQLCIKYPSIFSNYFH